jgi:hypothetical protein
VHFVGTGIVVWARSFLSADSVHHCRCATRFASFVSHSRFPAPDFGFLASIINGSWSRSILLARCWFRFHGPTQGAGLPVSIRQVAQSSSSCWFGLGPRSRSLQPPDLKLVISTRALEFFFLLVEFPSSGFT